MNPRRIKRKSSGRPITRYQVIGKKFKPTSPVKDSPRNTFRKIGARDKNPNSPVFYDHRKRRRKVKLPFAKNLPPKRHGKMVNRYLAFPGDSIVRHVEKSTGVVTTSVTRPTAFDDWLHNVSSTVGDHKRPNNQRFTHDQTVSYEGSVVIDAVGSIEYRTGVLGDYTQDFAWSVGFPNDTAYNKALNRLYEQLRGDIDISIDLAESHKTWSMMRDTLRSMVNLATTFRKMRRSNPRDWGNLWLEFTYGWSPTVRTIYDSAKRLMSPSPQGTRFLRMVGTASEISDDIKSKATDPVWGVGVTKFTTALKRDRCRIVANFSLVQSRLDELAGFTSLNPISVAWELTPYSFVVDWFVDFGGYLRDFENALLYGSNFVDGYVTEGSLATVYVTRSGMNISASKTVTSVNMHASARYAEKKRTVKSSIPFPRRPRFNPHLGASRLISGAALLGQMLHFLEHPKSGPKRSFHEADRRFTDWANTTSKEARWSAAKR